MSADWLEVGSMSASLLRAGIKLTGNVFVSGYLEYEMPIQIGGSAFVNSKIGAYSYVSQNCRVHYTSIGRYCSIADGVVTSPGEHPTDTISTSPSTYADTFAWFNKIQMDGKWNGFKHVNVGNDVWIGANAMIMGGVTIGDGAVIAAGAVVTKDVDPYSIIGGVPARKIRSRFPNKIVESLARLRIWEYDLPAAGKLNDLTLSDSLTETLLASFEELIAAGRIPKINCISRRLTPTGTKQAWRLSQA